jgi:hypothetical protein
MKYSTFTILNLSDIVYNFSNQKETKQAFF